ncbi:MAG: transporter substrate-binding domain-containing protein [Gammaproteobacteria bacterium]|nr:transporter substrate-binding domain-containing protein [Gammaproteobacteria bacterium]
MANLQGTSRVLVNSAVLPQLVYAEIMPIHSRQLCSMNMKLRSIVLSLFLLFAALSHGETLKVGAYHYPPFMNEQTHSGIYMALSKAIAAQGEFTFTWEYYPYARVNRLFDLGKLDIEIGSAPSWNAHKSIPGLFTQSFYVLEDVSIYRKGENKHAAKFEDIKGQTIGIVRGYSFPQFHDVFEKKLAKRIDGPNEAHLLNLLINERIDQVFMSRQVFYYLRSQNPKLSALAIGDVVGQYPVAIRVHPSKANVISKLNSAIKQLKSSGDITHLFLAPYSAP